VAQSSFFRISADRQASPAVGVFLSTGVLRVWKESHAREFSATERYAIARMALFQAFDERAGGRKWASLWSCAQPTWTRWWKN
jgi:hypothetical protein